MIQFTFPWNKYRPSYEFLQSCTMTSSLGLGRTTKFVFFFVFGSTCSILRKVPKLQNSEGDPCIQNFVGGQNHIRGKGWEIQWYHRDRRTLKFRLLPFLWPSDYYSQNPRLVSRFEMASISEQVPGNLVDLGLSQKNCHFASGSGQGRSTDHDESIGTLAGSLACLDQP